MIGLETLLGAAIGAGLSLAAEVGFGDKARKFKKSITGSENERDEAFKRAFSKAEKNMGRDNVALLMKHEPFRQALVTGLLDPMVGFDPASAEAVFGENFPNHVRGHWFS